MISTLLWRGVPSDAAPSSGKAASRHVAPHVTDMAGMAGGVSGWIASDAAVLAAADLAAERNAAAIRLATAICLALALAGAASATQLWDWWVALVVTANLLIACGVVLLTRIGRLSFWMPWALCVLDAAFLAAIAWFGPWFDTLPAGARAALVSPWAAFLLIALAALHLRARLILFQTALLALGFSLLVWWPARTAALVWPVAGMSRLFTDGANVARLTLICLTGTVLAVAARGARNVLRAAIKSSRERGALQRFVPPELGPHIVSAGADELRRGDRRRVTVLFADIRGFSRLSQAMPPESVASLLNSFRVRVARAVGPRGGVVDKFIGDGVLVIFGIPASRGNEAANALAAAVALSEEIGRWCSKRVRAGRVPVGIGLGLHIGEAFVGALGDERMEFTVIGDVVNIAQRLEEMTRRVDTDIIVSAELFHEAALPEGAQSEWRFLPELALRGREEPLQAFAWRGKSG